MRDEKTGVVLDFILTYFRSYYKRDKSTGKLKLYESKAELLAVLINTLDFESRTSGHKNNHNDPYGNHWTAENVMQYWRENCERFEAHENMLRRNDEEGKTYMFGEKCPKCDKRSFWPECKRCN